MAIGHYKQRDYRSVQLSCGIVETEVIDAAATLLRFLFGECNSLSPDSNDL